MDRPARTRLDVDERRASLLAVAGDLFEQRAFDEVSVEDVARAAGVSKGLLYHYFPGKRQLYVAYVGQIAQQLVAAILQAVADTGPDADDPARLRAALGGWMHFVRARPRTYEAIVRGGVGRDDAVQRVADDVRGQLASLLEASIGEAVAGGPSRIATQGWIGFVEAATLAWIDEGADDDPHAVIESSAQVLAMLRGTGRI